MAVGSSVLIRHGGGEDAVEYVVDSRRYGRLRNANDVTSKPSNPVTTNTSAIPRSAPVPNQDPIQSAPLPSVMNGITKNSVSGAMRNAVSGDAACSTLWAKPKTRPWR